MHQAAALSLHLVDKGSWRASRPGWISNNFRWSLFLSKRGPESSKAPSMITARPTAVPQKSDSKWEKITLLFKIGGETQCFSLWCKAILRAGGRNSMRLFIFLKNGTQDSLRGRADIIFYAWHGIDLNMSLLVRVKLCPVHFKITTIGPIFLLFKKQQTTLPIDCDRFRLFFVSHTEMPQKSRHLSWKLGVLSQMCLHAASMCCVSLHWTCFV